MDCSGASPAFAVAATESKSCLVSESESCSASESESFSASDIESCLETQIDNYCESEKNCSQNFFVKVKMKDVRTFN